MASPTSAQKASARKQFRRLMHDMLSGLKSTGSIFFHKRVNKSMATTVVQGPYAYALNLPIRFLSEHSKKFGLSVTFEVKSRERTWPIELTVRHFKHSQSRLFAYGAGGWKTFLTDNRIKVGDFLIFTLVEFSHFEVVIVRAPVEFHREDDGSDDDDENHKEVEVEVDMDIEAEDKEDDKASAKWYRNTFPWWDADQAPEGCMECNQAPPCPRFVVAIRPSSHPRHLSLAVPLVFWDLHDDMLECDDVQLRGPNKAIFTVEARRRIDWDDGKLSMSLESGWEAFQSANNLQVEDILEFFLVAPSCFTVDLVKQ